jgi:lipopolysaccharide export system protein LptA
MTERNRRRKSRPRALAPLLACLFLITALDAQEKGTVIVLDHADSLVGHDVNGSPVKELIGNVQFHQGSVVVSCSRAMQYIASNYVLLEGEVVVVDSNMRMLTNRGMYYGNDRIAEAFERVTVEDRTTSLTSAYGKYFAKEKKAYFRGSVTVRDTQSVLTARELTYDRLNRHSVATGQVKITSPHNRMTVFGDRFEDFKEQRFSRMTGHPRLIQIDSAATDTLLVTSRLMESYQDTLDRLVARDSVQIGRGELAAQAGEGVFYTQPDSIILRRSPFVWYTVGRSLDNQVSGDSIFIKLMERTPSSIHVRGDAFAVSRADSSTPERFNQMSGQEIVMHFAGGKLRRLDVERTATSLYYLFDGGKPNGLNKASGDRVTILFQEGKIDQLRVIAGPEGQYVPEKMVRNREKEYNLPGFNWLEHRPGKKPAAPG